MPPSPSGFLQVLRATSLPLRARALLGLSLIASSHASTASSVTLLSIESIALIAVKHCQWDQSFPTTIRLADATWLQGTIVCPTSATMHILVTTKGHRRYILDCFAIPSKDFNNINQSSFQPMINSFKFK